jgi:hypothetical protein
VGRFTEVGNSARPTIVLLGMVGLLDLLTIGSVAEALLRTVDPVDFARLQACSREARALPTAVVTLVYWREIMAALRPLPLLLPDDGDPGSDEGSETGWSEIDGDGDGDDDDDDGESGHDEDGYTHEKMTVARGLLILAGPPAGSDGGPSAAVVLQAACAVTAAKRSPAGSDKRSRLADVDWRLHFRRHGALTHMKRRRTRLLTASLAHRGLKLRSDSWLCETYIGGGGKHTRDEVVDKMEEMAYFYDGIPLPRDLDSERLPMVGRSC